MSSAFVYLLLKLTYLVRSLPSFYGEPIRIRWSCASSVLTLSMVFCAFRPWREGHGICFGVYVCYSNTLFLSEFDICRELPRVLTIYDIDIPIPEARNSIRSKFEQYSNIKDDRVIDMLIEKGYMDLEESLLQHTQRSHLLRNLSGNVEMVGSMRKRIGRDSTIDEQFARA